MTKKQDELKINTSRRAGGGYDQPAWKRGGFKSKKAYDEAVKKHPEIKEMLNP